MPTLTDRLHREENRIVITEAMQGPLLASRGKIRDSYWYHDFTVLSDYPSEATGMPPWRTE